VAGCCEWGNKKLGLIKRGISFLAEEGLCAMESVVPEGRHTERPMEMTANTIRMPSVTALNKQRAVSGYIHSVVTCKFVFKRFEYRLTKPIASFLFLTL
jgi:hypothetical protein